MVPTYVSIAVSCHTVRVEKAHGEKHGGREPHVQRKVRVVAVRAGADERQNHATGDQNHIHRCGQFSHMIKKCVGAFASQPREIKRRNIMTYVYCIFSIPPS